MLYALDDDGERVEALPGGIGYCPGCEASLIPKCGEIRVWHWAHHQADCDSWYEPESEWSLGWKRLVLPKHCEVPFGDHRADIVGDGGIVIKLQFSTPSVEEAREREAHFKRMIWLFDASSFIHNVELRRKDPERPAYRTFRWKWPRPTHARLKAPLYWDMGKAGIFRVRKVYESTPCGGCGDILSRRAFIQQFLSTVVAPPNWARSLGTALRT